MFICHVNFVYTFAHCSPEFHSMQYHENVQLILNFLTKFLREFCSFYVPVTVVLLNDEIYKNKILFFIKVSRVWLNVVKCRKWNDKQVETRRWNLLKFSHLFQFSFHPSNSLFEISTSTSSCTCLLLVCDTAIICPSSKHLQTTNEYCSSVSAE